MKMLALTALVIAGCIGGTESDNTDEAVKSTNHVSYLCVGMEKSARFGSCPGCEKDANRLSELMRKSFGYTGETLISDKATKAEVVKRLKDGIAGTPEDGAFLFFYSGHGGQERLGGEEPEGADSPDEYLCLYDAHMLDDEIWDIVTACRGRVFLYFDACHSATMYRSVKSDLLIDQAAKNGEKAIALELTEHLVNSSGFTFRPERLVQAHALSLSGSGKVRLLCWSGCKEAEYSYGSSSGGVMTSAVLSNWKKGITYDTLWEAVRSRVIRSQPGQNPVQTSVGDGFPSQTEAFR